MSSFSVTASTITIVAGDLVLYIPEPTVVPKNILQDLGTWYTTANKGRLAGNRGNTIKAIKLSGQFSQGLTYCRKNTSLIKGQD